MLYKKYQKVDDIEKVNELQREGWDTLERIKTHPYGEERVEYVMGYPLKNYTEYLERIIATYEKLGYKEELFKYIAEKNDERFEDIEVDDSFFTDAYAVKRMKESPTMSFMKNYEELINNERITLRKKSNYVAPVSDVDDDLEF
jgi:hypothetical protein